MSQSTLCGRDLSLLVGPDSPFSRVEYIDYDDGPTSGAVQCRSRLETYRFELLDRDSEGKYDRQAWDQGQEIRIFALSVLPLPSFLRLVDILGRPESRKRMAEDATYFDEVHSILGAADRRELVIATHGIRTPIIAARGVIDADIASVQDWFGFLGLTPQTEGPHQ